MPSAPRNAPCPCGSGRKYKKCCGFDREAEQAAADRIVALEALVDLTYCSPRLIPTGARYDRWLETVPQGGRTVSLDEVFETLEQDELRRIVDAFAELFPDELRAITGVTGEEAAVAALLMGAMGAGIEDAQRSLIEESESELELIEESEDLCRDPSEALALVLDGEELWEVDDGREADRAIAAIPVSLDDDAYELGWDEALRTTSARLVTDWHRHRLRRLVEQVERQLPLAGFPKASAAIETGCRNFATEADFQARLAATLLGDLVGRDRFELLRSLLAA